MDLPRKRKLFGHRPIDPKVWQSPPSKAPSAKLPSFFRDTHTQMRPLAQSRSFASSSSGLPPDKPVPAQHEAGLAKPRLPAGPRADARRIGE